MAYSTIDLTGGNKLHYQLINSRMIELFTNSYVEEVISNFKIQSLTISNKIIRVGDNFDHGCEGIPSHYSILKIENGGSLIGKYKHCYTLFSHLRNKTTTYILPCLGKDSNYFYEDSYLVNCYISQDRKQLYLLYRFAKSEDYGKLETTITKHPDYVRIDNSIPGMDLYVFNIPTFHQDDIQLFLKGKYSKISSILKGKIKVFYNLPDRSKVWRILNREDKLIKEMEKEFGCPMFDVDLENKPDLKNEIWNK